MCVVWYLYLNKNAYVTKFLKQVSEILRDHILAGRAMYDNDFIINKTDRPNYDFSCSRQHGYLFKQWVLLVGHTSILNVIFNVSLIISFNP